MTFDEAIQIAKKEVKDINARVYLNAIPRAIEEFGFEGLHTQILYAISNMGTWRGEKAREVKSVLKTWLKEHKCESSLRTQKS